MQKTGWQIIRSVAYTSTEGYALDKNGLRCSKLNSNNIPVSINNLKQAIYLESKINKTDFPPGQGINIRTYEQLYDIQGTYDVPETFPDPTVKDNVEIQLPNGQIIVVARYRGYQEQACPASLYEFEFVGESSTEIRATYLSESRLYSIDVKSNFMGNPQDFTYEIESVNPITDHGISLTPLRGGGLGIQVDKMYNGLQFIDTDQLITIKLTQKVSNKVLRFLLTRKARREISSYLFSNPEVKGAFGVYPPQTIIDLNVPLNIDPELYPKGLNPFNFILREDESLMNFDRITSTYPKRAYEGDLFAFNGSLQETSKPNGQLKLDLGERDSSQEVIWKGGYQIDKGYLPNFNVISRNAKPDNYYSLNTKALLCIVQIMKLNADNTIRIKQLVKS